MNIIWLQSRVSGIFPKIFVLTHDDRLEKFNGAKLALVVLLQRPEVLLGKGAQVDHFAAACDEPNSTAGRSACALELGDPGQCRELGSNLSDDCAVRRKVT